MGKDIRAKGDIYRILNNNCVASEASSFCACLIPPLLKVPYSFTALPAV